MFGWFRKKSDEKFQEEIKKSFADVKHDMDSVGKWIKHLDGQDKQLFDILFELRQEISSIKDEVESLREGVDLENLAEKNKQVFKKLPVLNRQTGVEDVQTAVQTGVQTANFSDILKNLSGNEKLLIRTLLLEDMKLSYEDLALMLAKEKSTIRGQVNSIKQKNEGLIEEVVEKSGKKRVFIPSEIKEKLQKYVKVRVKKDKKRTFEENSSEMSESESN